MASAHVAPHFSQSSLSEHVAERFKASDGSLPLFLAAAVAHLHELVKETRPTPTDWRKAIEFLTEVGHSCDERRQEWILLSDLLGVSTLIEEINSRRPRDATPNTIRGPFYRSDAPHHQPGASISLDGVGEPLDVSGQVKDLDGQPIAGATVETWQANAQGFYENQQPDLQPEFNLRGIFTTDADGRFNYRTVKPSGYRVPDDGPVGQLLGKIGYPLRRPAHLHFMISAEGFETITTHVFDASDPDLHRDALWGVRDELVREFRPEGRNGRQWKLETAFVMVRAGGRRRGAA